MPAIFLVRLNSKKALEAGAFHRDRPHPAHVIVAVDITQVCQVDRILGCFLGMAGESESLVADFAPVGSGRWILGKVPLRRASVVSPPGENQVVHYPRLEYLELCGLGRRGEGSGDALAADIELEAVKRANETGIAHQASGGGAKVGAQVWTDCLGHADVSLAVATR